MQSQLGKRENAKLSHKKFGLTVLTEIGLRVLLAIESVHKKTPET